MSGDAVVIRGARDVDASAMADVWLRSFGAALPTVRRVHDEDDVRRWFAHIVVPRCESWVADAAGRVVGLMVLGGTELEQLYLDPEWRGRGLGDRFIELAKRQRPERLSLWTFQVNGAARRFYEQHGFVPVEWTDGARNEEQEPDVGYVWQPRGCGTA